MEFGERLKGLRIEKGFTQEDVANALCVTKQAVSKWENGASLPDVAYLGALADLMEVNIDYLLTGNDNVKIEKQIEIVEKEKIVEKEVIKPVEVKKTYTDEEVKSIVYKYMTYKSRICVSLCVGLPVLLFFMIVLACAGASTKFSIFYIMASVFGLGMIFILLIDIYAYKLYKKEEQRLRDEYGDELLKKATWYKKKGGTNHERV